MKIGTWNVNGIRARSSQLVHWIDAEEPDVICLQEIKATPAQIPEAVASIAGYHPYWHGGGGYSGVALLLRTKRFPETPVFTHPPFDYEHRIVVTEISGVIYGSLYGPNGGKDYPAKIKFLTAMEVWAGELAKAGKRLVLCGDYNVARKPIDVHPTLRKDMIGQSNEERALIDGFFAHGLVDLGRYVDPDNDRLFTWWAPWRNLRERNIGWRLDYVAVHHSLVDASCTCKVYRDVGASDHGPVIAHILDPVKLLWPLVILVLACGKKPEQQPTPGSAAPPGSATPAGVDLATTFTNCWAAQSKGDAVALEKCYAPEAVTESPGAGFPPATQRSAVLEAAKSLKGIFPDLLGEPQLILVHYKKLVAVVRLTGTAAESKKPMGVLGGVVVDYNAAGQVTHESDFFDSQTIRGQVQPDAAHPVRAWDATSSLVKQAIASKGDAAETANVATVKAMVDAFDKHDLTAFAATIADDGTWSDAAEQKDFSKAELLADRKVGIQGFPDLELKVQDIWAAGDYVVELGEVRGTNTGAIPGISTPTKKAIAIPYLAIHQIVANKVAHTWVFDQASAFVTQLGIK